MSDQEWDALKQSFRAHADPLPTLRAAIRGDRRRLVVANLIFFGICAFELVSATVILTHGEDPKSRVAGVALLVFIGALSTGFVWMQRGLWRRAADTPRALLAVFERRTRAQHRIAHLTRWFGLAIAAFTIALTLAPNADGRHVPASAAIPAIAFAVLVGAVCAAMPRFIRRRVARRRERVERWRQELGEGA